MTETHKPGTDGHLEDGVSYYPASQAQMQTYATAQAQLANFQAPILYKSEDPHSRLYIASFDGTGNDANKDPEHRTNVSRLSDQVKQNNDPHVKSDYLAGPGTQDGYFRSAYDGATGSTYGPRTEEMYKRFTEQAARWKAEDPDAKISVLSTGFSRGAEQAAGFTRLVEERGIQDPTGAQYKYNADGLVESVKYTKPPLQAPGGIAQAEALYDPVNTGTPERNDRRPPPSVISGFQITADDERRRLFKTDQIIKTTDDGRFLNVNVAGAHSDIGGSYHRDGLSIRNGNMMIDYANALSDKPFLRKTNEPQDQGLNVVHRSEEGMILYRWDKKVDRTQPEGQNAIIVPKQDKAQYAPDQQRSAEPVNQQLSAQFTRQPVNIGLQPNQQQASPQTLHVAPNQPIPAPGNQSSVSNDFDRLAAAAATRNDAASRQVAQNYAQSPEGQALLAQGQQANQQRNQTQQQQQAAPEQQQQQQQQQSQQQLPNPNLRR
ncbi:phospholipase effector Tle1 domain-containing protein [Dyella sp.]|uniref:phospholipase effector Tle1 domain-containing protein n=1 Tax=Dyella sp. TaxID=1869338 RepID=UPI002ED2EEFF